MLAAVQQNNFSLKHGDEVLTRQCPCLRAFDSWRERGRLADSTALDRNRGIARAVTMVRRWDLAMVEKEMACASLCVGSMRD
jgi:hypothetical protein